MKTIKSFISGLLLLSVIISGCGKSKSETYEYPSGGDDDLSLKDEYPSSIKVEQFTDALGAGAKCVGWYAIVDMKAENKPVFRAHHQEPAKTPTQIFAEFNKDGKRPYIVTNAGYFWAGKSLSVCINESVLKSIANQTANAKGGKTAYPVRAAFGMHKNGTFEATWVYCPDDGGKKPYSYPSPLDNDEQAGVFMASMPSANTPGAALWTPKEGIGGGPMLVKEGKNVAMQYYWKEVLDAGGTGGTARHPRTAIGATKDGKLIVLVCDGRGKNDSKGFTLKELAAKLIFLGADIAINLDGGGSSTFVGADGKVKNLPSDSKKPDEIIERQVPTALVISEK